MVLELPVFIVEMLACEEGLEGYASSFSLSISGGMEGNLTNVIS